jgi:hypothetical protein
MAKKMYVAQNMGLISTHKVDFRNVRTEYEI